MEALSRESVIPECLYRESRETGTGLPIKTLGGDVLGSRYPFTANPNPDFRKRALPTNSTAFYFSDLRFLF